MKKGILTLIVIVTFSKSYGQDNNIKFNLTPLIWGEIRLGYERVINENQTAQLNIGVMIPKSLPTGLYDPSEVEDYGGSVDLQNKITGFSVSGEYRFYTGSSKDSPRGFYIAPYLKWNKYKIATSTGFAYEASLSEYLEFTPEQQMAANYNGVYII